VRWLACQLLPKLKMKLRRSAKVAKHQQDIPSRNPMPKSGLLWHYWPPLLQLSNCSVGLGCFSACPHVLMILALRSRPAELISSPRKLQIQSAFENHLGQSQPPSMQRRRHRDGLRSHRRVPVPARDRPSQGPSRGAGGWRATSSVYQVVRLVFDKKQDNRTQDA